jgi:hypothetical protein
MCTSSARSTTRTHAVRTAPLESTPRVAGPERSTLRVGDPERDKAAASLGVAFTLGYLSIDEYDARLSRAFGAQTAAELDRVTSDLPADEIRRRDPRRQAARLRNAQRGMRAHLFSYVALSVLLIGIWLAVGVGTGSWYFWPIWPILGVGIGVIGHAMSVAQLAPAQQRHINLKAV